MRKLITVVLLFSLVLPAAAYATEPDCDLTYAHSETLDKEKGAPFFSMIKFTEDHRCYYSEQLFYFDRPGTSFSVIGTWEITENDEILVKLSRTSLSFTLHFLERDRLINTDTMQIYDPINTISTSR